MIFYQFRTVDLQIHCISQHTGKQVMKNCLQVHTYMRHTWTRFQVIWINRNATKPTFRFTLNDCLYITGTWIHMVWYSKIYTRTIGTQQNLFEHFWINILFSMHFTSFSHLVARIYRTAILAWCEPTTELLPESGCSMPWLAFCELLGVGLVLTHKSHKKQSSCTNPGKTGSSGLANRKFRFCRLRQQSGALPATAKLPRLRPSGVWSGLRREPTQSQRLAVAATKN